MLAVAAVMVTRRTSFGASRTNVALFGAALGSLYDMVVLHYFRLRNGQSDREESEEQGGGGRINLLLPWCFCSLIGL